LEQQGSQIEGVDDFIGLTWENLDNYRLEYYGSPPPPPPHDKEKGEKEEKLKKEWEDLLKGIPVFKKEIGLYQSRAPF